MKTVSMTAFEDKMHHRGMSIHLSKMWKMRKSNTENGLFKMVALLHLLVVLSKISSD